MASDLNWTELYYSDPYAAFIWNVGISKLIYLIGEKGYAALQTTDYAAFHQPFVQISSRIAIYPEPLMLRNYIGGIGLFYLNCNPPIFYIQVVSAIDVA